MSCKDICIKFQAHTLGPIKGHYTSHRKRCSTCYIFINWDGSGVHVATLHLEQDCAMEIQKSIKGVEMVLKVRVDLELCEITNYALN